jgi:hypothetical protein
MFEDVNPIKMLYNVDMADLVPRIPKNVGLTI